MVRLQHLLDPSVETLDHAVGLRVLRGSQAMLDPEVTAQQVELVPSGGGALAQTEQAVGKLLSVIGQNGADAQRAGPPQVAQEAAGVRGGLGLEDADENPAGRPPLGVQARLPGNGSMATNR